MYVFDSIDVARNKVLVMVSTIFPILFFLPLVASPDSQYGRYYANQTLLIFIANIIAGIIPIVRYILSIVVFVLYIINIVHAYSGNGKEIPLIGKITIIR